MIKPRKEDDVNDYYLWDNKGVPTLTIIPDNPYNVVERFIEISRVNPKMWAWQSNNANPNYIPHKGGYGEVPQDWLEGYLTNCKENSIDTYEELKTFFTARQFELLMTWTICDYIEFDDCTGKLMDIMIRNVSYYTYTPQPFQRAFTNVKWDND